MLFNWSFTELIPKSRTRESMSSLQSHSQIDVDDEDRLSVCSSAYSSEVSKRGGSLARIDLLGRYESLFDNSICTANDLQPIRGGIKNMFRSVMKQPAVQETPQSYEEALKIVES